MQHNLFGENAVFSINTLEGFDHSGERPYAVLKRAALLFDKLIFHPQGLGDGSLIPFDWAFARIAAANGEDARALLEDPKFRELFIVTDELTDDPAGFYNRSAGFAFENPSVFPTLGEFAWENAAKIVGSDQPSRELKDVAERLYGNISSDAGLFFETRKIIPNAVGLTSRLHAKAFALALEPVPSAKGLEAVRGLNQIPIVDFAQLSWQEVLRLRESGFINEFRAKASELSRENEFETEYLSAWFSEFLKYASRTKPQIGKTWISLLLGSLPTPGIPVNPFSVGAGLADIREKRRVSEDFGWLFFLLDAVPEGNSPT